MLASCRGVEHSQSFHPGTQTAASHMGDRLVQPGSGRRCGVRRSCSLSAVSDQGNSRTGHGRRAGCDAQASCKSAVLEAAVRNDAEVWRQPQHLPGTTATFALAQQVVGAKSASVRGNVPPASCSPARLLCKGVERPRAQQHGPGDALSKGHRRSRRWRQRRSRHHVLQPRRAPPRLPPELMDEGHDVAWLCTTAASQSVPLTCASPGASRHGIRPWRHRSPSACARAKRAARRRAWQTRPSYRMCS